MNTIMLYIKNISSRKKMLMMFNENNKSERKKKTRYDIGTGFVKIKNTRSKCSLIL